MSFELLLCGVVALYGLLNFVMVPRLKTAWNASHSVSKITKAGVLAAVEFARDLCFVAAVLYFCFALLTVFLHFGFFGNVGLLKWAVFSASGLHESFEKVSDFWDHWFFLFPLALLAYFQWLRQRKDLSKNFERHVDEELDRLNEERTQDPQKWNQVAADEKILDLDDQILKAKEALRTLIQTGSKDKTERRRLLRLIVTLKEERSEKDYERRIDLDRLNVQENSGAGWSRWRRVLLSKGLFSDLKGFSQLLSRTTLALLTVALIGVAGNAGLTKDLWESVINLDELRVEAHKEQAKESWEKRRKAEQQSSPSDSDRQAINQLANDFGRALARNPNWQTLRRSARSEQTYDRMVARRAILTEVRLPDANGNTRAAFVNGLNNSDTEVIRDAVAGPVDHSHIGQIIQQRHGSDIKSWFGEKWANLQVSIHHHAQSYYEPVSTDDLQGALIDRIVAVAFDATEPADLSDVMKQAREGMSDATKEAVREAVETEFEQFMNDLYEGKPYEESIKKVRNEDIPISKGKVEDLAAFMHDRNLPDRRDLNDRMAGNIGDWKDPNSPDHPSPGGFGPGSGPGGSGGGSGPDGPTGGAGGGGSDSSGFTSSSNPPPSKSNPPGGSAEGNEIANDIARRTTSDGTRSLQEEQVGALAQYEDHFPRSVASQSRTPLGQLLSHYRVAEDAPAIARVAEMNVARASSFTMLRGFSKVGGVLIGRAPHGTADIRDMRWTINGRDVKIGLVDAGGKESWFGPFDRSIVHQSLAYAADGRPVAVTMTIARPVSGLKVFLHPALLDTPLGCRVQQLDRLVDTYAGGSQLPERGTITQQYFNQTAVYNVALAKRMEAVAEKLSPGSEMKQNAQLIMEQNAEWGEKGLHEPDLFSDGSLMHRKPEFFEPALIKTMKNCRKDTLDAFEVCVLDTYRASRFVREFKKDYLRTWSYEPATIEPWSGVRERDYQVSDDLSFLKPPAGNSATERLWPFDFMVQIAFTSPAVNLPEKQQEVYVDRQPVEFDQIQGKIEQLVDTGIQHDHFDAQFKDLRDFVVLQRLFRAVLNGNLGDKFPTLKMAQLTRDTADGTPYYHTRRWNSSSLRSFVYWSHQASVSNDDRQPWIDEARPKLALCTSSVLTAYTGRGSASLSSACDFSEYRDLAAQACTDRRQKTPACFWRNFISMASREVTEAAFGVLDDDRQNSPSPDCPPLASSTLATITR